MKRFGEKVKGYAIPVMNEREIRASAGILLVVLMISVMSAILKQDFLLLKYFIIIFLIDFILRLFVSPRYSSTLILGRFIVSKQVPEYVGAAPKKFAWIIGLVLATTMFVLSIIVNSFSPITGIICLICMIFLLFESSFGICLGCLFYPIFFKEKPLHCPGEICEPKTKHDIQKISIMQILIFIGFIVFIILAVIFFKEVFSVKSHALWNFMNTTQTK
jgi:hypothetical protein